MARPSLSSINAAIARYNAEQRSKTSTATDEGGNPLGGPSAEIPELTQEQYDKLLDDQLWGLVQRASVASDYYSGDGNRYRVADNDPLAQQFAQQFGTKELANVEMNNKKLDGLIHGKGDLKLYGKDPAEWMQDPSRIMYLDDGSWVIEAGNLKGDALANMQSENDSSGLGDSDAWWRTGLGLVLGGGTLANSMLGPGGTGWEALGAGDGMTPPGGWDAETIANVLGPPPEVTIPDLMDPLNPTSIPDIQTPSLDVPVDTPSGWEGLGPGDGMSPPEDPFTNWLDNYLSDSGSTTQLPFGEDAYTNLGIDPNAVSAAGTFEGMGSPTWYESLFDTAKGLGSSFVNRLPALAGALKGAIPQGGAGGRSPGLGGVGGGGGGFGGGGSGRGLAADAFEAERLKQIKSLAEYLGSLK